MKNLYDVIKENPSVVEGKGYSESDLAAANYLFSSTHLTNSKITEDGAWVHVNSEYDETVEKMMEKHPRATELILGLADGYRFIGGVDSQIAYLLVSDYVNKNFGSKSSGYSF